MSQCSGNAIDHEVELHYYTGIRNFGDELSPYLISKITGRKGSSSKPPSLNDGGADLFKRVTFDQVLKSVESSRER